MRDELPRGTVTVLFTDIEGSTRLLAELGSAYADSLAEHRRVVREACGSHGGVEVDTQGDAFFVAFADASAALAAAAKAQATLELPVRMGVHTGEPELTEEGYVGLDVHRAARICAAAHGGQVVVSGRTHACVLEHMELRDLGTHRLKDLADPVRLYQLGDRDFPPLRTIANTNLPTPTSTFLGRESELHEADRLLRQTRLLTVTGPGGAGKTRFALELAHQAREARFNDYPDGVFACFLASVRDSMLVLPTLCTTLEVREQPRVSALEALVEHLEGKRMLLMLDNLEHVLDAAPELSQLLNAAQGLSLAITSRELLRVDGETAYQLPALGTGESTNLFCERARLEPTEAITELCSRLDGLPLAIELAAARTSLLTPDQLLDRLSQRLDLLKAGRDADPRQQTLRATIEWSYELLSDEEKVLFARLSIFAGGCTLESSEAVCDADLDTLESLVDKSLIRRTDGRIWMLETIREFASGRLAESGEYEVVLERVVADLVAVAQHLGAPSFYGEQAAAGDTFEREHPNVRTVAAWATNARRPDLILALTAVLWMAWINRGHSREALSWIESARTDWGDASEWPEGSLIGAGEIARFAGDPDRAVDLKHEALQLVSGTQAAGLLADLAEIFIEQDDLARASDHAKRSCQTYEDHGWSPARALLPLGEIALRQEDLERAEQAFLACLESSRDDGDEMHCAYSLEALGEVYRLRRDLPRARELFIESLRFFARLGDARSAADSLLGLAQVALEDNDDVRASRLWGAGQALGELGGWDGARRRRDIGLVREPERTEGAAMALDEALEYAESDID